MGGNQQEPEELNWFTAAFPKKNDLYHDLSITNWASASKRGTKPVEQWEVDHTSCCSLFNSDRINHQEMGNVVQSHVVC